MEYTVKEIAKLTGVTVKTLHHYHKIGLLKPRRISDAGYRIYGMKELECLQQILFYRELDFPLKKILEALEDESNRLDCLKQQHKLLTARRERMESMLGTLNDSIIFAEKGESMDQSRMFKGLNQEEWKEVLKEQKDYLKDNYEYEIDTDSIEVEKMNEMSGESERFMAFFARALRDGWKPNDTRVQKEIERHINFLNKNNMPTDTRGFTEMAWFFIEDDFHRDMLESQQTGLSYYLYAAAEMYAQQEKKGV